MNSVEDNRVVEQIRSIFPGESQGHIIAVLRSQNWNTERAIDHLLWLQTQQERYNALIFGNPVMPPGAAPLWQEEVVVVDDNSSMDENQGQNFQNEQRQQDEDILIQQLLEWGEEEEGDQRNFNAWQGQHLPDRQETGNQQNNGRNYGNNNIDDNNNNYNNNNIQQVRNQDQQQQGGHDSQQGNDSTKCVVCLTKARSAGFAHRNSVHKCVCAECSTYFGIGDDCPVCRQRIQMIIKNIYE